MKSLLEIGEGGPKSIDFGTFYVPGFTAETGEGFPIQSQDFVDDCAGALIDLIRRSGVSNALALETFVRQNPQNAVQVLIDDGRLFLVVRLGSDISVYSRYMRDRWPRRFADYTMEILRLFNDTKVAWYQNLEGDPTIVTWAVVAYGKNPVVDKSAKIRTFQQRAKSGLRHGGWIPDEELPESIVTELLQ